jgi:aminoglycoside phosphotransferase (APT) family kinase protein
LCDDPAIIGAIFFVMERRRGLVLRREIPAPNTPTIRISDVASAKPSSIAWRRCTPWMSARAMLGKPAGFLARQVSGWAERWQRAETETLPQMEQLIRMADAIGCRNHPRQR